MENKDNIKIHRTQGEDYCYKYKKEGEIEGPNKSGPS